MLSFLGHLCNEQASTAKKHLLTHSISISSNFCLPCFLPRASLSKT